MLTLTQHASKIASSHPIHSVFSVHVRFFCSLLTWVRLLCSGLRVFEWVFFVCLLS